MASSSGGREKGYNRERGGASARSQSFISQLDWGLYPWKQTAGTSLLSTSALEEEKLVLLAGSAASVRAVFQARSMASALPVPESHSYSPRRLLGNSPEWGRLHQEWVTPNYAFLTRESAATACVMGISEFPLAIQRQLLTSGFVSCGFAQPCMGTGHLPPPKRWKTLPAPEEQPGKDAGAARKPHWGRVSGEDTDPGIPGSGGGH